MTQELPQGTVTVLFTDVVGSTDLGSRLGDNASQEILGAQRDLVREQIVEHSGHEVKGMGDGFMVAFASARKAVACAVGIQRALVERNANEPPDQRLAIRIGLHTGEVIEDEADLFGETVNAAARVAAKAKGGQVLISETAKGVMGRAKEVELVDRGRFRLKGIPERWRLFEVVWQEEGAARPVLAERTPYVGREAERAELRRFLDRLAGGQGSLVMIGGEPGVGKTRLAQEVMAEARERGMNALIGHCYEMEGAAPYTAYVEILEAAARMFEPEVLREALGESAPEVAKLMPELRRMFPDIPPPPDLPPEQERRFLFNGMREFVGRTGLNQPVVYVVDDLHWADDSTLLLLQHLAQQLHEMPVLIIGTYRDVELDVARPLAKALEELLRQRLAHRISLRRLPEGGVAAMLKALSDQEPPAPLVEAVYKETEGNPFFVEEVFHHLAEEGKLFDEKGRWRSDLEVSELDVPEGVRLVIGRRLERVGEECRRVLTSAAVVGRAFSYELVEAVAEVDGDTLLDAIDDAERAQLIVAVEEGALGAQAEARFAFAHELIRQTLISGLSLPRRQRMHLRIAEAMEHVYSREVQAHAADLAHHLYQAGAAADPEKAARYLTLAGDQAIEAAAFEDALKHYEDALPLQPPGEPKGRAALLYKRGQALRSVGRWEEALADWREALPIYEELDDGEATASVCRDMAWQLNWGARWAESEEVARRGLAALAEGASAERCRLLLIVGASLGFGGDYESGDRMLRYALEMAEELGDQHLLGTALTRKAELHVWYVQAEEAAEAGLRGAALLRSAGHLWDLAETLFITQYGLTYLGRFDEAAELAQEADPLAERLGHLGALMAVRRGTGSSEFMRTGDIDRYEEFTRADLELCRSADMPWISASYSWLGFTQFRRGRWREALENLEEGARLEPPGILGGADWARLCVAMAYMGNKDEALAMLNERRADLPRPGKANTVGSWFMLAATIEALAVLGKRDEAANLYPLAEELVGTGVLTLWDYGSPHAYAGMAAAAGGQWAAAEAHFEEALRVADELPLVTAQPEVRRWYARMLLDRDGSGDRDKARALLTEAVATYKKIGMPKHVEMAEAMLRD